MHPWRFRNGSAALLCAALVTSAAAQAQAQPSFTVSGTALGAKVTVKHMAAVDSPYGDSLPAHQRAVLSAPTIRNFNDDTEHPEWYSYIAIFPLNGLKNYWSTLKTNELAATRFNELKRTLIPAATGGQLRDEEGSIYDFPSVNAAQVASGSLARLSTPQVQGYRFLAWYAQDGYRASRYDITYNFVGVTRDGKHLVVAHLPYEVPTLSTPEQVQQAYAKEAGNVTEESANRLLQALTTKLEAEARTGRLAPFDAVVKAIQVK